MLVPKYEMGGMILRYDPEMSPVDATAAELAEIKDHLDTTKEHLLIAKADGELCLKNGLGGNFRTYEVSSVAENDLSTIRFGFNDRPTTDQYMLRAEQTSEDMFDRLFYGRSWLAVVNEFEINFLPDGQGATGSTNQFIEERDGTQPSKVVFELLTELEQKKFLEEIAPMLGGMDVYDFISISALCTRFADALSKA
jgi:hypothetical protein